METLLPVKEEKSLFTQALVCEVELTNGKRTKAIVLFDGRDLNFEDINMGLNFAFARGCNISKNTDTLCGIKSGELNPYVFFEEYTHNK